MILLALFFAIGLLNLLAIILKKNNKIIIFLSIVIMAISMAFASTEFGDLLVYITKYNTPNSVGNMEIGYTAFYKIFSSIGVPFNLFRLFTFIVCIALVNSFFKKYIKNYHIILFMYLFTFFVFLSVALRSFIAISIVLFSLKFFIENRKTLFILFVVLAATFHIPAILSLVFLFYYLPTKKREWFVKISAVIGGITFIFCFYMLFKPAIINQIVSAANGIMSIFMSSYDRMEILSSKYLSGSYSLDNLIYVVIYGINVLLARSASLSIKENVLNKETLTCSQICVFIINFSGLILPGVILNQTLIRFIFLGTILCFFLLTISWESSVNGNNTVYIKENVALKGISPLLLNIVVIALWYYAIYGRHALSMDLIQFISNNTIFG